MSKLAYNFDMFQKRVDAVDRSNGKRSGAAAIRQIATAFSGILIRRARTPANLKLEAPHFNRCARTEVFLFGFAINCSPGIEPALHDGLPGATGASNHAQQRAMADILRMLRKAICRHVSKAEASSSAEVAGVPWLRRFRL